MNDKARILIVDDDESTRRTLALIFERVGYEAQTAGAGCEAVERARQGAFNVAFLDIRLPDVAGVELLAPLKALHPDMPIVMMTAYASLETAVQALNDGASAYITKPFDVDKVLAVVGEILEKQRLVAEKRQAQAARRESEARYRGLFEHVPISLWEEDFSAVKSYLDELRAQGVGDLRTYLERHPEAVAHCVSLARVLDVNQYTVKLYEASSKEEMMGALGRVIGEESRDVFKEELIALAEGKSHFTAELVNRTLAGNKIHVSLSLSLAPGAEDTWDRVLLSLTDISERVRSERALQRYAERLRTLHAIDGAILGAWSPLGVAQAGLRHLRQLVPGERASLVTFDMAAQEATVLAVDRDAEVGFGVGTCQPLGDVAEIEALARGQVVVLDDVVAYEQPSLAVQALQSAGMRAYLAVPLVIQGELIGCLALESQRPAVFVAEHIEIAREVAHQLAVGLHQARLRAALEGEQRRLNALVTHLPEGVLLLGPDRQILLANPAAETYLSALTDAGVGVPLTHLAGRPVEQVLDPPPEGLWHELQVPRPPNRTFEVLAQPVAAEAGLTGWVLLLRDVTQERQIHERAQQQQRLAAVGQLAAGIAHDFNNIMASIVLYAGMMLRTAGLAPADRERLDTIRQQGHHAARLVQQILDFSRQSVMERQPLHLVPFLKELVKLLERTLPDNIRLNLSYGEDEYRINADPTRMQQALMNLAINARDAMPQGGTLRFQLEQLQVRSPESPPLPGMRAGAWVRLAVKDTGTGIGPQVLPHVFEPFFTTKAPGQGAGLGLAQVHGIVGQHEGHVDVATQMGAGTTFFLYLPALLASGPEVEGRNSSSLPAGRGETILLVEDDARTRGAVADGLELLGYRVLAAANGQEALDVYRLAGGVDLVLTDVVMPELGGAELMRKLREVTPDLKGVAMTGHALAQHLRELEALGDLEIVYKPLDLDTLARVVRQALDAIGSSAHSVSKSDW